MDSHVSENLVHFQDGMLVYDLTGTGTGQRGHFNNVAAMEMIFGRNETFVDAIEGLNDFRYAVPTSFRRQIKQDLLGIVVDQFRKGP